MSVKLLEFSLLIKLEFIVQIFLRRTITLGKLPVSQFVRQTHLHTRMYMTNYFILITYRVFFTGIFVALFAVWFLIYYAIQTGSPP